MTPFEIGYNHGHITGRPCSRREAETRFPAWSHDKIESYLNGRGDGEAGDSWRLQRKPVLTSTELTPEGEQHVIPGCEAKPTEKTPQGNLW